MLDMFSAAANVTKSLDTMSQKTDKSIEILQDIAKSLVHVEKLLIELLRETSNG